MSEHTAPEHTTEEHHHSDTVSLPVLGTITVYGGIYTVIFGALAVLTALEVLIAELLKGVEANTTVDAVRMIALGGIAVLKALLVVWFYMHLRSDNPFFRIILVVPLILVTLSVLYLIGVPIGEGLGYR